MDTQILCFEEFSVRTFIDDTGDPWFVLKDICDSVGISDYRGLSVRLNSRLDEDEMSLRPIETVKGPQIMKMVSESGVYEILMTSNAPRSLEFRRWLRREVLPALRKKAVYIYSERADRLHGENSELRQKMREVEADADRRSREFNSAQHRYFSENKKLRVSYEARFELGDIRDDAKNGRGKFAYDVISDAEVAEAYNVTLKEANEVLKEVSRTVLGKTKFDDTVYVLREASFIRLQGWTADDYRGAGSISGR